MSLDDSNPITALQSKTIQTAIAVIVINVLTLVTAFTGKEFDITAIQDAMSNYLPMIVNVATLVLGAFVIKHRVNATQAIKPSTPTDGDKK